MFRYASAPRLRTAAVAACLTATLAVTAPAAGAAAAAVQGTKSVQLQWASAWPADPPFRSGVLTVGGVYTCTEPAGTSVAVSFNALQILPLAMPSGSGTLPCGPGVIDAPWELASFPNPDVHSGWTNVLLTFDGQGLPAQEFTA